MIQQLYTIIEEYLFEFLMIAPLLTQLGIPLGITFLMMLLGSTIISIKVLCITALSITAAIILGDLLAYIIGRKYGDYILTKISKHEKTKSTVIKTTTQIKKNLIISLFITRTVLIGIIFITNYSFGQQKIPLKKLLFPLFLAELLYVSIFLGIGYLFKDTWSYLFNIFSEITEILLLLIILYITAKMVTHHYKKYYIQEE